MIIVQEVLLEIPDFVSGGGMHKEDLAALLEDIANAARAKWIKLAGDGLKTTRQSYIAGIQEVEMGEGTATVSLVGVLPNIVENGMEAIDLRTTLLGPNVPVAPFGQPGKRLSKAGGFYRAIPFRHGTPGNEQQNVGPQMGSAYTGHESGINAQKLGKEVYKKAKLLGPSVGQPYTKTKWGDRLPEGVGGVGLLKPHHTTDIYAGMVKMQKTYAKATQNFYMTFRTISTAKTEGWIRPATPPKNFAGQVAEFVTKIAPMAFTKYVEGLTQK